MVFYYLLNSEPHFFESHYSLAAIATSVYVRQCELLMALLSFDSLWASTMFAHTILDVFDISSATTGYFLRSATKLQAV